MLIEFFLTIFLNHEVYQTANQNFPVSKFSPLTMHQISMFHFVNFSPVFDAGAVPKKILDLMNVEKLTRENVASHLQVKFFSFPHQLYII